MVTSAMRRLYNALQMHRIPTIRSLRAMDDWQPGYEHGAQPEAGSPVLAFADGRLVVASADGFELPRLELLRADGAQTWPVGELHGETVFALALADPGDAPTRSLRAVLAEAPAPLAAAA